MLSVVAKAFDHSERDAGNIRHSVRNLIQRTGHMYRIDSEPLDNFLCNVFNLIRSSIIDEHPKKPALSWKIRVLKPAKRTGPVCGLSGSKVTKDLQICP